MYWILVVFVTLWPGAHIKSTGHTIQVIVPTEAACNAVGQTLVEDHTVNMQKSASYTCSKVRVVHTLKKIESDEP